MSWIMTHVYDATKKSEYLRNAINIWRQDILRLGSASYNRVAELYWNIGKAQDLLSEYTESSESFKKASLFYLQEAKNKPKVAAFYKDYSKYMEAWAEFEQAKQAHKDKNYLGAKDHYQSIASIFESTERWSYLGHNYRAWASLEEAEAHSMRESPHDAIDSFRKAIDLFEESRESVQKKLDLIEDYERENGDIIKMINAQLKDGEQIGGGPTSKDVEEKENLSRVLNSYGARSEYCQGRVTLEQAAILMKQGEMRGSSRRYGEAAGIFSGILSRYEDLSLEIQPFQCISQAWQYLTQAEAEASPEKFGQATELFENVKDSCSDESTKRVIQGHAFFCRALEYGTRFDDTRDPKYLSEAVENFENATNMYKRVSLMEASEHAKAYQRLFEAYGYMVKASKESEPKNKAAFYSLAEKLFEGAAVALRESGYTGRSDEVARMLDHARREREVAVSLSSLYCVTGVISPSQTYPVPMPTVESAVGLEKFEKAEVQASSNVKNKQCTVGEQVEIDIEVDNVGKGRATLLQVEHLTLDGFRIIRVPDWSRIEQGRLNLRGRALKAQESEDISLVVIPRMKGEYSFRPLLVYKDEAGEISSHMVSLDTIKVREVGIRDWIRGSKERKS